MEKVVITPNPDIDNYDKPTVNVEFYEGNGRNFLLVKTGDQDFLFYSKQHVLDFCEILSKYAEENLT